MAKTASLAKAEAPAKKAGTSKSRNAAAPNAAKAAEAQDALVAQTPAKKAAAKPRAKKASVEAVVPAKAPRKPKPAPIDARRLALAAEFRAEIELYSRAFNESLDCAIDRLVAEHDELDRIVGEILALAVEAKGMALAA